MKWKGFCLFALMMLAMLPTSSSQFPSNNEWEFGWDTEVEPSYDLTLDGEKWKIENTLVYFVDNPRVNDLSLVITVEFEDDVDVLEANYEESITVSAQSNETFSIELTTSDAEKVRAHSPDDKITILVRAEQDAGGAPVSPKEIDAKLNVPRYHKLVPEVNLVASSVDAGTWIEETLKLNNMGNSVDAASKIEAEVRGCPLLDIENVEQGEATQIQPTGVNNNQPLEVRFKIAPSTAHPSKSCEVLIIVTSEGNGLQRSTTFEIDIDESGGSQESNNDDTGSSSSNSDADSGGSSALPTLGSQTVLILLGFAALVRRNRLRVY